jgi:hypothetical protein
VAHRHSAALIGRRHRTGRIGISVQWNVITRTIPPVIANPSLGPAAGAVDGLGDLQFNAQLGAYYNVVRPDFGSEGQVRARIQLMLPK